MKSNLITLYSLTYTFKADDPSEACRQTAIDLYLEDIASKGLAAVGKVRVQMQLRLFDKTVVDFVVNGAVRPVPKKVAS